MSIYTSRALSGYGAMAAFAGGGAFGVIEDYSKDSSAQIKAKIKGFTLMLAKAKAAREDCNKGVAQAILTGGITMAVCVATQDGQINWYTDRISEAKAALILALENEKQAKIAEAQVAAADAKAAADMDAQIAAGATPTTAGGAPGGSGSSRSAMTATSDNTMLYVGLGVGALVLVGGGIFLMRRKKAAPVAGYGRRSRRSRR